MARRLLIFGFGVATYLIFLPTVAYAIGFVGNRLVPKSIDIGDPWRPGTALAIDLSLIACFGIQHRPMAAGPLRSG